MITPAARQYVENYINVALDGDFSRITHRGKGFQATLDDVNYRLKFHNQPQITRADLQFIAVDMAMSRGKAAVKAQGGPQGAAGIHQVKTGAGAPHKNGPIALMAAQFAPSTPQMSAMDAFGQFDSMDKNFDVVASILRQGIEPHSTCALVMDMEQKRFKDFSVQARAYLYEQAKLQQNGGQVDEIGIRTTLANAEQRSGYCLGEFLKMSKSYRDFQVRQTLIDNMR